MGLAFVQTLLLIRHLLSALSPPLGDVQGAAWLHQSRSLHGAPSGGDGRPRATPVSGVSPRVGLPECSGQRLPGPVALKTFAPGLSPCLRCSV